MAKRCSDSVFRWCVARGAVIVVCRENDAFGQKGPRDSTLMGMLGQSKRLGSRLVWSVNGMLERDQVNAYAPEAHAFLMGETHTNAPDAGDAAWPLTGAAPRTLGFVQAAEAGADVDAALRRVAESLNLTYDPRCFYSRPCIARLHERVGLTDPATMPGADARHNLYYPRGIDIVVQWPRMHGSEFYWYTAKPATKSAIWWGRGVPVVAYRAPAYDDYAHLFGYNLVADSLVELRELVRVLVQEPRCAAHYARLGRLLSPYFSPYQRSVELFEAALCHYLRHFNDK